MTLVLRNLGAAVLLLWRSAQATRRVGLRWREVQRQLVELGSNTLWLIGSGLTFFGAVVVVIAWAQARKYTGNITLIGPAYFELMVREFAPVTTSLLVAARVGASTSAELASMSVNEQIEALELSAADPLAELVTPRILASLVAVPLLTVVGTAACTVSAFATLTWYYQVDGHSFVDPRFLDTGDVACAVTKTILCGLYIPVAAALRGLRARQGAAAVGAAVTSGVVDACMGCLLIDFAVAMVFLLIGV